MIILETERLILRTWEKNDLTPMTAISEDPKVMEYFPAPYDQEKTALMIKGCQQQFENHGYSLNPVILKNTGEFIGFVGLLIVGFEAHFTPAVEIGWRLASKHWGNGYAPEAARAVLKQAFAQHKLDEVVSFTAKDNLKSRRVMEKIGMSYDPKDDFNNPKLDKDSPLSLHVLYRARVNNA